MYIKYSFKINDYDTVRGTMSVTYIPKDETLDLKPTNVQQLGFDLQDLVSFSSGDITEQEFLSILRKQVVAADGIAQDRWNSILRSREIPTPQQLKSIVGEEWDDIEIEESQSTDGEKTDEL